MSTQDEPLSCRSIGEIGGEIIKSQAEFDNASNCLQQNRLIEKFTRPDGKSVACVTEAGVSFLQSKKPEKWTIATKIAASVLITTVILYIWNIISGPQKK
ncbi:MAG: hypothetical protein ABSC18_16470 [Verrucomicrobiota bacterium]|jgi:hypothetical protein